MQLRDASIHLKFRKAALTRGGGRRRDGSFAQQTRENAAGESEEEQTGCCDVGGQTVGLHDHEPGSASDLLYEPTDHLRMCSRRELNCKYIYMSSNSGFYESMTMHFLLFVFFK